MSVVSFRWPALRGQKRAEEEKKKKGKKGDNKKVDLGYDRSPKEIGDLRL